MGGRWQEMKLGELDPSGHLNPPGLHLTLTTQICSWVPRPKLLWVSHFPLWALSPSTPHPAGRCHQWIHPLSKLSTRCSRKVKGRYDGALRGMVWKFKLWSYSQLAPAFH